MYMYCSKHLMYMCMCTFFQALSEVEDEDLVEEERQRKAAVRKTKMESGLTMEDEEQLEKKAVSQ